MNTTISLIILFTSLISNAAINLEQVLKWSNIVLAQQDQQRQQILANFSESESKWDNRETYFELVSQPAQRTCKVYKKLAGRWSNSCGFMDGEKLVCMDGIYQAIQKGNCLIYSFGLADDWDFEIIMAKLGCVVRAFDPSTKLEVPEAGQNQPNIHLYRIGLGPDNGHTVLYSSEDVQETIRIRTLKSLLTENGDFGKPITYLKIDIEGYEIWSIPNLLKTNVFKNVNQLGIEMHTAAINKARVKSAYPKLINFFKTLSNKYGLELFAYQPNLCKAKESDGERKFYSHHDLLFVKSPQQLT